jgi:eukaryotic-like serine/threonine-protein kinase
LLNSLYIASLSSRRNTRVAEIQSNVAYVPAGPGTDAGIIYIRDGALVFHRFNGKQLIGEPVSLAEGVRYSPTGAEGLFGLSSNGRVLSYGTQIAGYTKLSWFDRTGKAAGVIGVPDEYDQPRLSPDGFHVAFNRPDNRAGNRDIWTFDVRTGIAARLTSNPANDWFPVWSPDGRRMAFTSDRQGGRGNKPHLKSVLEADAGEQALGNPPVFEDYGPRDWSRDERWITLTVHDPRTLGDIWITAPSPTPKPSPFLATEFDEQSPRLLPDGDWLAYVSNETGRTEVYVRPFRA